MSYQGSKLFSDIAFRFSIPLDHVKKYMKTYFLDLSNFLTLNLAKFCFWTVSSIFVRNSF